MFPTRGRTSLGPKLSLLSTLVIRNFEVAIQNFLFSPSPPALSVPPCICSHFVPLLTPGYSLNLAFIKLARTFFRVLLGPFFFFHVIFLVGKAPLLALVPFFIFVIFLLSYFRRMILIFCSPGLPQVAVWARLDSGPSLEQPPGAPTYYAGAAQLPHFETFGAGHLAGTLAGLLFQPHIPVLGELTVM